MKRCLFPGSFDPFTKGHEAIVQQALFLFDEVVIGVGINSKKQGLFSTAKKIAHIQSLFLDQPQVRVA
jgi:pantetheine-phosphate adenylyltransferase